MMTDGKHCLRTIRLRNLLSYGPESDEIELGSLNVMIGPNASGKSNLIEAIGLLKASSSDLAGVIREGGPVGAWLWKGGPNQPTAEMEVTVEFPQGYGGIPLRHRLAFAESGQRLEVVDEAIENAEKTNASEQDVYFFYRYQDGHPVLNVVKTAEEDDSEISESGEALSGSGPDVTARRGKRRLRREEIAADQSVLSQRKGSDTYPELSYLVKTYSSFKLYREWNVGRNTAPRKPQDASLPHDALLETGSNLGLVLNELQFKDEPKRKLKEALRVFNPGFTEFQVRVQGGSVQLFLVEKGLREPIPATRLSDGTLRYLCLIAVLCHPTPPPVVCIEEPELALHPDVIPFVGELMIDASQRTQLIVTTHSDALISAFSHCPENVLVCSRAESGTVLERLDRNELKEWLERYALGDLWRMGEVGGTAQ